MSENLDRAGVPTVAAYGEPDDHLRMTVLIAEALQRFEPDAAKVCRRGRRNPWPFRFAALQELLRAAELRSADESPAVRVRDAGVLRPADLTYGAPRWTDWTFARENASLLAALEGAPEVVRFESVTTSTVEGSTLSGFDDDLQPLARWLLDHEHLSERSLQECLRRQRPRHVLVVMWDVIDPDAREAALRLSAFRAPQHLNGVFGPIALRKQMSGSMGLESVSRPAVDMLLTMGLLRRHEASGEVYFPRQIREFLRACANEYPRRELQADHITIARAISGQGTEDRIEQHYHAVQGRDAALALRTSKYYGADLRTIAREASLTGAYDDAATIYRNIVESFDARDAYAWEYLGFNLWRPYRRHPDRMRSETSREIGFALSKACTVDADDSTNPLYLGRLVGFLAVTGNNVSNEFRRHVREFSARLDHSGSDGGTPLAWFAQQVRTALSDAGKEQVYEKLCAPWVDDERLHRILTNPYETVGGEDVGADAG